MPRPRAAGSAPGSRSWSGGGTTAMRPLIPRVRAAERLLMYVRFVRYLLWEFRWPLVVFWTLVLGGGLILHRFYHHEVAALPLARACHAVFLMIFLESSL